METERGGVETVIFCKLAKYIMGQILVFIAVLRIRIWIRIHRIHMFLGLPDPNPLVRGLDPDPDPALDPDPFIIM